MARPLFDIFWRIDVSCGAPVNVVEWTGKVTLGHMYGGKENVMD